jgi:outer membrane protein, multidrug efflux system
MKARQVMRTSHAKTASSALLLCSMIVMLMSCAMGPDYERPSVTTPDTFRIADEKDLASIANMPWWELLQDEALQSLIRTALQENKDLKRAVASVEEFQARLAVSRMDFAPKATAQVSTPAFGRKTIFLFPGFASPFNYYALGNLSWEIDFWGRIRRLNEAATGDLFAQEENRRALILQLVGGVAEAYFDLLQYDMQLDIARRTLQSWEESVRIAQARLRQGIISKLDADQFEAERANAAARSAELERQMVQKENQISVLVGRNPSRIRRGHTLTEQVMPPAVPSGLPSELLQRRPDVVQAEQQLAAATARIGVAKAERFPQITITGLLGVAHPQLSRLITNDSAFGVIGPGLAGPLFNSTLLGYQQKAIEAQARQALAQYEQRLLVAFREVEDSLVAVKTARDQREAQQAQVEALRSAHRLATLRYKGGLANYLDVLIAQRNLFEAELALTATHRLHLVSIVQLYRALGGGWLPETAQDVPKAAAAEKRNG